MSKHLYVYLFAYIYVYVYISMRVYICKLITLALPCRGRSLRLSAGSVYDTNRETSPPRESLGLSLCQILFFWEVGLSGFLGNQSLDLLLPCHHIQEFIFFFLSRVPRLKEPVKIVSKI